MKKVFFSLVILVSLGFLWLKAVGLSENKVEEVISQKSPVLQFALVADSHNDNENLKKALDLAKERGASFVIGLGDWSDTGTMSELTAAKRVFDQSGLTYYLTAGDHDLWDSRNRGEEALANYMSVFGNPSRVLDEKGVKIVLVDNSDIYKGLDDASFKLIKDLKNNKQETINSKFDSRGLEINNKLLFVMAHKTPFHPTSEHIMGSESRAVADQANRLIKLIEENEVDGFFSGDLHFFAGFHSPGGVKITTIGAVSAERNFQGPRFAVVSVYGDWSWEVEDVEIR